MQNPEQTAELAEQQASHIHPIGKDWLLDFILRDDF